MDDDYDRDSDSGSAAVFLAFILGGLTGAALALLYAPRSGEETRDLLAQKVREGEARAREAKERALAKSREVVDDASGYIEKQKQGLDQRKERFVAAVEAGRQAYKEEKQKGV
jgi:gas vesicle protein